MSVRPRLGPFQDRLFSLTLLLSTPPSPIIFSVELNLLIDNDKNEKYIHNGLENFEDDSAFSLSNLSLNLNLSSEFYSEAHNYGALGVLRAQYDAEGSS
jgi:hypothetical protein